MEKKDFVTRMLTPAHAIGASIKGLFTPIQEGKFMYDDAKEAASNTTDILLHREGREKLYLAKKYMLIRLGIFGCLALLGIALIINGNWYPGCLLIAAFIAVGYHTRKKLATTNQMTTIKD